MVVGIRPVSAIGRSRAGARIRDRRLMVDMRPPIAIGDARNAIVELAARQHGVVALRQLEEIGVSRARLRTQLGRGWLRRVHVGVYAVAGRPLSHRGRWLAAVLAGGPAAVLSHGDAAALWRIADPSPPPAHVTVRGPGGRGRRAGLRIHRRAGLPADETTVRDGIAVTTPARTILDLASLLPRRRLERAIDEAEYRRVCTAADLEAIIARHRGRAGAAVLAGVLRRHAVGTTRTRTELEEMFLALCRRRGLPQPLVNAPLLGLTVDFLWPPAVVVEVDGGQGHLTRRAFQGDRDRDSLLAAHGYRVIRFTWWDVERRAGVVADRVRRVLARQG